MFPKLLLAVSQYRPTILTLLLACCSTRLLLQPMACCRRTSWTSACALVSVVIGAFDFALDFLIARIILLPKFKVFSSCYMENSRQSSPNKLLIAPYHTVCYWSLLFLDLQDFARSGSAAKAGEAPEFR
jgi:hypothetical protein